jgi:hypothetical protein
MSSLILRSIDMKTRVIMPFLVAGLVLLSACKTPLEIYATRSADMQQAGAPRLHSFGAGEQAAIVVDLPKGCGWREKAGTVWVDEAISGRNIWSQSRFMREGSTNYFLPEGLGSGSYFATLMSGGEPISSINFEVH